MFPVEAYASGHVFAEETSEEGAPSLVLFHTGRGGHARKKSFVMRYCDPFFFRSDETPDGS